MPRLTLPFFSSPFSVFGMPLLAIGGLLVCLWHPQAALPAQAGEPPGLLLVSPDPRLDRSLTVFLRQEARDVAYQRRHGPPSALAQTIDDYNLIARECTPAVFQATHLPPSIPS